jgi:hypothetical protein
LTFRTAANKIAAALAIAYPKAKVEHNPAGKPRKGAFEVSLASDSAPLYSKLTSYGAAKNKEHLATPERVLELLEKKFPKSK